MPLLDQLAKRIADRLPTVIGPAAHAVIDYATAASFLAYGVWAWKRDRRAALTSIGVGASEIVVSALTAYPGGVAPRLSFTSHGRIDMGLAAIVGTMPDSMGFRDDRASRFFRMQAVAIAAVTGLTDFERTGRRRQLQRIAGAA